jgi:hypothetical protein
MGLRKDLKPAQVFSDLFFLYDLLKRREQEKGDDNKELSI